MTKKKSRLLAAIMFTDMVGYTALMQKDEQKAKANRDRHRKILQNSVATHGGKILQFYGDGTLIIFNSAIEGVDCAIQVQSELQREPKIPLRIGIHTGDIVYDDEGVYGDGVNVASRIEGLAVSGSILISGKVFDEVKNHQAFSTRSLGTFELKNVTTPLEVYAISNEGLAVPTENEIKSKPKDKIKSLAVLPFINMSSDPENEYFSDGITEELLNVLAQEPGLQVTARTSSFAFKGRNEDIKQIGAQLGAKTILEGSVRKAGNRIRITAQLISTADGYHIWSETYDRQLEDIFEVQDEIAHKIRNRLREKLTLEDGESKIVKSPTDNLEAYNIYLKGLFHSNKWTLEDAEIAMNAFYRAIELEPDFALPHSRLSYIYIYLGSLGKRPVREVFPKAKEHAQKAIQLDPQATESYEALANVYFHYEWKWDKSYQLMEKAIELNPSYAAAYLSKAIWFTIHASFDEAIDTIKKSIQLDPFNSVGNYCYGAVLLFSGRIKESSIQLDKLFEITPHFPDALALRGLAHQMMGEYKKALDLFMKVQKIPGFEFVADGYLGSLFLKMNHTAKAEKYLEKLLSTDIKGNGQNISFAIASIYANMDKQDEMFHYLKRSAENRDNSATYILVYPHFKKYHQDPRFVEIVKKIGLWK
jgi:TolB-like protein/Tfp pilus assembly protein PilF